MLHLFLQKLLDKIFETGDISDILKIGTLFPVYKNKGDHKDENNHKVKGKSKDTGNSKSTTERVYRRYNSAFM